ncbi:hypothetical protein [Saccharothrix syringae]|uniref:Uncharacterized protein n=1 Tax=Saccharothrix syringae TaxID=103733 RepID=A0A5Q0H0A6_SACSY|nr:hypothetical protein [Saccharothrix syringae]QFZ19628.1 hypothetical protein EKG83_21295 [Saccharothrix syringae]
MVMTTWDGHLRIDHLADAGTVTLTLVTVEPATEVRLRAGLVAGFVTADPHGPPASVAAALQDGRLPDDVVALLGPRVAAAVAELLATGRRGRWLQLDLVEVDDLAAAWAPYRGVALESGPRATSGALGSWAGELWTCLGVRGWRDLLRSLGEPAHALGPVRSDGTPPTGVPSGTWRLPDALAAAVGVAPEVAWELRLGGPGGAVVELLARPTGRPAGAVLQAGVDDGSQRWVPFEADGAGGLRARLTGFDEAVSVRFRSETRRTA